MHPCFFQHRLVLSLILCTTLTATAAAQVPGPMAQRAKTGGSPNVKVLGHLVPREMKVEHSQSLKSMSDEELEAAIELVRGMLAARAGDEAKVIEGTAETVALPAPAGLEPPKRKPNRLMMEVDTAIGPQERKPRKRVPSPAST